MHTNLRLLYLAREEWLKGRTKMWNVFPNDMGMDNAFDLALANLDLKEPVLEPITFYHGDPLDESLSTPIDANLVQDMEKKDEGEESGNGNISGGDDFDYQMHDDELLMKHHT
jgi:hypothetical protein